MIDFELWTEVHARFRQGHGKRKIARERGLDRKTVKRILAQERPVPYRRTAVRPTVVTPDLDDIHQRATEVAYNAYRIFHELQEQGYPGGYEMVKLAVRPLRAAQDRLAEAPLRFETAPGRQAQVDWGTTWAAMGGQRVRVHIFVMVLGYARRLDVELTRDQQLATLVACHQHAFDWFGGFPEEWLYDNPQTVVRKRDWAGRAIEWHPQFWDFAQYSGFTPRLCRPYRAQTNGKGESGLTYVKRRFVQGRQFPSGDALNLTAQEWVVRVADQRIHGTTFRKPAEAFTEERWKRYTVPKLLMIDEIGDIPIDRHGAHLFFQLISRCYERGAIILTANQSFGQWAEVFGDAIVATAILDRLLHPSHVINIKGDSYRLKEQQKAGLLHKAPAPEAV